MNSGVTWCLQVAFIQKISTAEARGAVEKWLLQVQDIMLMSIRDVVARSKEVSHLFLVVHLRELCRVTYACKSHCS